MMLPKGHTQLRAHTFLNVKFTGARVQVKDKKHYEVLASFTV